MDSSGMDVEVESYERFDQSKDVTEKYASQNSLVIM